ncbi:MAG: hypothetical protein GF401_07805 [Chitinivibrionales bacterium]|nr:hypothetical protein [Chitinivibrionales bacterium]
MDQAHETAHRNGRFALLFIGIGGLLALESFTDLSFIHKLWPLLITMLGIGFIGIFKARGRREVVYLIPGVYLICFSILALFANFYSWSILTRTWPLFIAFLGLSFFLSFLFARQRALYLLTGLMLVSISSVFFLVFSISGQLWWTIFILAGMSILISERAR